MDRKAINQSFIKAINFILLNKIEKNKADIVRNIGIKYGNFAEMMGERQNVGSDVLSSLCEKYNISADFLLTGKGEMIKDSSNNASNNCISNGNFQQGKHINDIRTFTSAITEIQKDYLKIIEAKDEQIKRLIGIIENK